MSDFPTKTKDYIKNLLTKQQKEVEKSLKEMEQDDPATSDSLVESSEPGTDSYVADSHIKSLALEQELKKIGSGIKSALLKIKNGKYGKCERCGKQIEIARLLAMPTAQ